MTLTAFIGPVCLLIGIFLALYVKDKAREVAKQEFAEAIKLALATFKDELVAKFDAAYSRLPELKLMLETRDNKVETLEDRVDVHQEAIRSMESCNAEICRRLTDAETDIERLKGDARTKN